MSTENKWKVLVVDDEEEISRTLKNFLVLSGYNVAVANSGAEALSMLSREKFHIVLSDIKMPVMSGLELLEKIKEIDFSIQVIMMTGFSTFEITIQALEKGATDYIMKPFKSLDEITDLIEISTERISRWKDNLANSVPKKDS